MIKRSFILDFLHLIFKECVNITFQCALAFAIEKKIVLVSDDGSRPPIVIKSHNLHVSDIRGGVGEITSYHKRD
jgi:hypothetical protein